MLSNIISLLAKNETYLNNTIADKLGVGERMARQMLHELARFGYVENIDISLRANQCKKCSAQCCSRDPANGQGTVWMLTEKGRKAAGMVDFIRK